jgi:Uma2 family endonuclease
MASTTTRLMTVEEFAKLPETAAYICELRKGEVVQMTRPVFGHIRTQHQLRQLIADAAGDGRSVYIEAPFRPLPEYELRVADVAYAARERWDAVSSKGYLAGVPDLVIEILSPSNTAAEMLEREQICLENGCREFWIVDLDRRQVRVSTPVGRTVTYKAGTVIPVFFAPGKTLAVDAIFAV